MKVAPITTVKTIVTAIEDGGGGIKVFSLMDPDGWDLPPFRPGAHVDVHLPGGFVRTYSLCNDPVDNTRYVIAVKREASGRGGSIRLHDEIKVGDRIGVTLPRGGLVLDDTIKHVAFVAGGIGITPFLSAAAYMKRAGRINFTLHLMARGAAPMPGWLAAHLESGHLVIHDTSVLPRPQMPALIGELSSEKFIGCCGPESMIHDFEQATRDWPSERVHIERFVPPVLPIDPNAKPYVLSLARSKIEVLVTPERTMLDALLELGIDIPASCCGGICGSCRVDWLEGAPLHRDRVLSPAERMHSLMVCVAGSSDDRLVLDL